MDQKKKAALVALAILGLGAWWLWSRQNAAAFNAGGGTWEYLPDGEVVATDAGFGTFTVEPLLSGATNVAYTVADSVTNLLTTPTGGGWTPPQRAAPYLAAIDAAERANGIPRNLLARLIYQESRFRSDIINGGPNHAGAIGIAQIIPRWNPGVDPRDPFASIAFAGRKLAGLRNYYGNWRQALAAYNYGEGNLAKVGNEIARSPLETRNYVAQITADVVVA